MASTSFNHGGAATTTITAIHPDIIETQILTRIDGPTLASTACTSPFLHSLCREEKLWQDLCSSTWTSIKHPLVQHTISTFPGGHRSFFSDSFPILHPSNATNSRRDHHRTFQTSELISAVDIQYKNKLVYSKVVVTNTDDESFLFPTFWVDLLGRKESGKIPILCEDDYRKLIPNLEDNLTLSWIVIDPTRKRAANVSSLRPVLVHPHWAENDIEVRYATVMAGDCRGGRSEFVECRIGAIFGCMEGRELELKEVNLQVQDMDRRCLNGKDSLGILQDAMESGRRKKGNKGEEKERYREYVDLKRERRERKMRRERRLDMASRVLWATSFISLVLILGYFPLLAMFS